MRAQEFVKPHQMAKLEKTGRIVEILRHQDQVDFSDEPGWYLINLEPGKRVAPDMKWIPDSTRFSWVREFKRTDAVVEDITPNTIHKLADRTGVKWDNEPSFLQLTKRLTGKEHLDDLNQTELHKVKQHLEKQGVAEGFLNEASSDEAWELVGQPVPEIQQFVKQMGYGNDEQSVAKITPIIDKAPSTQIPAASIPKLKNLANKGNDAQTLKAIQQISGRPDTAQQYTKIMQARDAGEGRQRDVSGYLQYVKSGNYDPPVLLKLPTGTYVIGGRTRLYAALALGVPANVKIISANNFKQGVAEGSESYPEVLYHGSTQEIKGPLTPRQSHDIGGAPGSNKNAIYATDDPNFAIAYSLAQRGSDTGTLGWKKDPHLIFFGGKIRHGQNAYVHVLPTRDQQGQPLFVRGDADAEWYSRPEVKAIKPIKVEVKPVDQYLHLLRKPTPEEQKLFQANKAKDKAKQGVAEGKSNDTAISLSKLGKFHPGADTLAEFVPERATAQYALHPDKWESTFYSLTNKDSDKLKYYGPKKISIPPGTLVGDMAIANKFYRAKTTEEKQQYAEAYKASLQPYPVDVSKYRMPELLIPKQGVAENFADGKGPGRPGDSVRHGIPKGATMAELERASHAKGRKGQLARWQLNMRRGKKK